MNILNLQLKLAKAKQKIALYRRYISETEKPETRKTAAKTLYVWLKWRNELFSIIKEMNGG